MLGLCRVQEEVKWRQQLLAQNNRLLQSLRVELKVFEKLDEEHRIPRGTRRPGPGPFSAWALFSGYCPIHTVGSAHFPEMLPSNPRLPPG